jgi:hypothetical protein
MSTVKMKIVTVFITLTILIQFSCQKDDVFPLTGYEEVTLKNLTGFDGCGFVFQKTDDKYLEPTNIDDFLQDYSDGEKYWIKYQIVHVNSASICQVGDVIKIVEIKDQLK